MSSTQRGLALFQELGLQLSTKKSVRTSAKDTVYRSVLGLSDSQSEPLFRQISDSVKTGRDDSGKSFDINKELSLTPWPYGSVHISDQSCKSMP